MRWHMITEPHAVRRVLQTRIEDYPKSEVTRSVLRPAIGESMLIAEGEDWRRQRRMAAPAFQPRHVRGLAPIMGRAAETAACRISKANGRAVDMLAEMMGAAFDVIADATFSGDPGMDRGAVHRAIEAYGAAAGKLSFLDVLGAPDWVPRPARMRTGPEMGTMKALADEALDLRASRGKGTTNDLLDLLLEAEGPDGAGLSREDIRDNLLAFIVAGHETTALTLAWAFYLLGFDTGWQDRARAEAVAVLGDRTATAKDTDKMPIIRAILDETLRLYPPAGFLSRTAREPDQILGTDIYVGDTVTVPVYAIHRHQKLWTAPDAFRPGRWLDHPQPDRYTYLPFGDGPRICIGARFALQEAMIILSTLLARYRFAAVPGRSPKPTLIITLRPEGGVWMTVEPV